MDPLYSPRKSEKKSFCGFQHQPFSQWCQVQWYQVRFRQENRQVISSQYKILPNFWPSFHPKSPHFFGWDGSWFSWLEEMTTAPAKSPSASWVGRPRHPVRSDSVQKDDATKKNWRHENPACPAWSMKNWKTKHGWYPHTHQRCILVVQKPSPAQSFMLRLRISSDNWAVRLAVGLRLTRPTSLEVVLQMRCATQPCHKPRHPS